MAYTKLFSSIIASTVWAQDAPTKIVWITLLALADKEGEVMGSVPGLAHLARVSVEECDAALQTFMSPDPYSRTPTAEGRRIEPIDGGWQIINHAKYRRMASKDDQKEKAAARQARFRKRNATITDSNGKGTQSNAYVTQDRDIAEAEEDSLGRAPQSAPLKKVGKPSPIAAREMAHGGLAHDGKSIKPIQIKRMPT